MADDVEQDFQASTLAREMRSVRSQWAHHVFVTTVLYLQIMMVPFGALVVLSIYFTLIDLHNLIIALVETCVMCSMFVLYAKFTSEDFTAIMTFKKAYSVTFIIYAFVLCTCPLPFDQHVDFYTISFFLHGSCCNLVFFTQRVFGGRSSQFPTDWHNTAAIALSVPMTLIYLCVLRFVVITKRDIPNLFKLINLICKLINLKLHED